MAHCAPKIILCVRPKSPRRFKTLIEFCGCNTSQLVLQYTRAKLFSRIWILTRCSQTSALRYQLTILPARPALLVALVVTITSPVWYVLTPSSYAPLNLTGSTPVFVINGIFYLLSWWFGGFTVYHAIHQWRAISRADARLSNINLFQLRPLYALSGVTARTAIGFVLYMTAWSVALPSTLQEAGSLALALRLMTLACITFLSH